MMKRLTVLALTAVAVLANEAPVKAADVSEFDILGIELGMTADEVVAQANARGFDEVKQSPAPSFEQAVALANRERVQPRDYSGVLTVRFQNDAENAEIAFVPTPTGSRAVRISYSFLGSGVTLDQMTSRVLEKYGEPERKNYRYWLWGDTAEYFNQRKSPFLEFDRSPVRGFGPPPVGNLELADPGLRTRSEEAIARAVAERATGETSRF